MLKLRSSNAGLSFRPTAMLLTPRTCGVQTLHLRRCPVVQPFMPLLHSSPKHMHKGMGMQASHARPQRHIMARALQGKRGSDSAIETAVRQELGMQSNRLPDNVRERVEAAIERQRYKATIGEIAAQAGLKLSEAEDALKALAYDSQAVLQVSSDGDVVYAFSPDFKAAIRNKSFLLQAKPALAKAQSALSFLVRITFGTALFASILVTYVAIMLLLSSARSNSDDRDRGSSGVRVDFFPNLWYYWTPGNSFREARPDPGKMSLPEAIFSFVFGDGDPNKGYEEQRWRALGRYIQSKSGVVTAEEMAPYLDPPSSLVVSGSSGLDTDDAYVLPALIKFEGEPFVDEAGHLLYRFPSLQKAVLQREYVGRGARLAGSSSGAPEPQYEQPWQLTAASPGQLVAIVGLGILNVVGVVTLGNMLADPYTRAYVAREGLGWIANILPGLSAYAAAFFAIPAFRFVRNLFENRAIEQRNEAREQAAEELASPGRLLDSKLASARRQGEQKLITKEDIVFSTEKDAGQQVNAQDMADWDARLGSKQVPGSRRQGGSGGSGW